MRVTLSVATSVDGYIDDMRPERLVLSTAEDWEAVYALRGNSDAILIGGETLRRDDPRLRGVALRVVVSGSGAIDHNLRIFGEEGRILIFSNVECEELTQRYDNVEIVVSQLIDAAFVVTELEKRGVERLMVEGGAAILNMFLGSGLVDVLRLACNPAVEVGDESAPRFAPDLSDVPLCLRENLGGMEVLTYRFDSGDVTDADERFLARAVALGGSSPAKESCYRVGAVVLSSGGELFEGYTLETSPTHHAEQAAISKALAAGVDLRGATMYASMEPCSVRSSEPESCSEILLRLGFSRVLFALYEPSHFVECHGAENLRRGGVEVHFVDSLSSSVRAINSHILCDK
ncbi:MAG: dihydrofolate reductase family protein [Rikenellaceae bacterium]